MCKKILYHHRTQRRGAEGVHIDGIQEGFRQNGYGVEDMSLFDKPEGDAHGGGERTLVKKLLSAVAATVPNHIFKLAEVAYNAYSFCVGCWRLFRGRLAGTLPTVIYERYVYFNFGLTLAAKLLAVPMVLEVNTTCLDYDVREIRMRWLARRIERYVFSNAALITVVSGYLQAKIVHEYGVPHERVVVLPNAVDPARFRLDRAPLQGADAVRAREFAAGHLVIGFVGVFVPWHGLDFLLEVFERVAKELSDYNPGLLLIGDGPVRPAIEADLVARGLQDRVLCTGMVPHDAVKEYVALFDLAIMPDSNPFGSPMKIFEYMAMAKPVVAPEYAPIQEVVADQVTGFLFKPRDIEACCASIRTLISRPELRVETGARARSYVIQNHTWDLNVRKILTSLPLERPVAVFET